MSSTLNGIEIIPAVGFKMRLLGLIAHPLHPGQGLLLLNCHAIHTWFMKFPLDLVFLDSKGKVVALHRHVLPWRFARCSKAIHCLELRSSEQHVISTHDHITNWRF